MVIGGGAAQVLKSGTRAAGLDQGEHWPILPNPLLCAPHQPGPPGPSLLPAGRLSKLLPPDHSPSHCRAPGPLGCRCGVLAWDRVPSVAPVRNTLDSRLSSPSHRPAPSVARSEAPPPNQRHLSSHHALVPDFHGQPPARRALPPPLGGTWFPSIENSGSQPTPRSWGAENRSPRRAGLREGDRK